MNVKTFCLGILSLKESSGYQIKKGLEEGQFSHFIDASYGSIYPALRQLAKEGYVTVRAEEQSGKPDKKVYAITPSGQQVLAQWLSVIPARDKYKSEFLFQMLMQDHLPMHVRLSAIDKQLADLRHDLGRIVECRTKQSGGDGPRFVADYGEAVLRAAVAVLEQNKFQLLQQPSTMAAREEGDIRSMNI